MQYLKAYALQHADRGGVPIGRMGVHHLVHGVQRYAAAQRNDVGRRPHKPPQPHHHLFRAGELVDKVHLGVPLQRAAHRRFPVRPLNVLREHKHRKLRVALYNLLQNGKPLEPIVPVFAETHIQHNPVRAFLFNGVQRLRLEVFAAHMKAERHDDLRAPTLFVKALSHAAHDSGIPLVIYNQDAALKLCLCHIVIAFACACLALSTARRMPPPVHTL